MWFNGRMLIIPWNKNVTRKMGKITQNEKYFKLLGHNKKGKLEEFDT